MKKNDEMEEFDRKIGEQIRKLRVARGWSQEELASRMNMSATFISKMERGTSGFVVYNLNRLCEALNVSPNRILMWESKTDEGISGLSPEKREMTATLLKEALQIVEEYELKK